MANKQKFTKREIEDALRSGGGRIVEAAGILKCDYKTVLNYFKRYPSLEDVRTEAREELVDRAEIKLGELIDRGEPSAVFFTLKTQGRHRGYIERGELDFRGSMKHTGGVKVELTNEKKEKLLQGAVERYFERRGVSAIEN